MLADAEASDPATADRLEQLDLDLDQIAAAQLAVATYSLEECRIDLAVINAASVTTLSTTPPTLPPATPLIHQPAATADALEEYLRAHPEYDAGDGGTRRFLTTGAPGAQNGLVAAFWGGPLSFEAA